MARRQLIKSEVYPTPLNQIQLAKAALYTLDKNGKVIRQTSAIGDNLGQFLLNPSSWEESKSANWIENQIPGQSDPVLQWLHSGPRTVSFEALVTVDTGDFDSAKADQKSKPQQQPQNFIADIASSFFKISLPAPRQAPTTSQKNITNYDITTRLDYYRSLLYPIYDDITNPKKLRQSPPLVILEVGTSITLDEHYNIITSDQDVWVVTNLRIKITKQLPNLLPLEAIVNFELKQYTIKSFDRNRFL